MENLIQDIRFGLRSLIKHRAFAAIAIITLALGVGANSTIFSVVNATLMRSLPVSHPESLVYVFNGNPGSVFSYPDYAEVRDQNHVFDGLIGFGGITVSLNSNDQTDLVNGAIVTGNYFQVLGVLAQKGRVIAQEDDKTPGAHPVAVISHGLWQRRFGGDQNVVGRQLLINGQNFTIIGVTPPECRSYLAGGRPALVWGGGPERPGSGILLGSELDSHKPHEIRSASSTALQGACRR